MAGGGLVRTRCFCWSALRKGYFHHFRYGGVSATVLATSNNLIVSGSLQSIQSDGTILFSQLSDPDNNVSVGDKVVTSNISDKYLPGILIGYIDSISTSSNNLTKSGTVTPAVDFSHLDEVLVVMEQKQQTGD